MSQPRLPGVRFVFESRAQAIASARAASGHASTANDIRMVVFCDGSLDQHEIHGGIAVTYHRWLPVPSLPPLPASARGLIEFSRPVNYIFDSITTEAISLCQALTTVVNQITAARASQSSLGMLVGQRVRVVIFNDCESLLRYLSGTSRINAQLRRTIDPIIRIISLHASRIQHDLNSSLEVRWIPGHGNGVYGHQRADRLSRSVYRHRDSLQATICL